MGEKWSLKKYLFESRRQFAHMAFGLAILFVLQAFKIIYFENARIYTGYVVTATFLFGMLVVDWKLKKKSAHFLDILFRILERPNVTPGYGAFWLGIGMLALFAFLTDVNEISAGVLVLAAGDAFSTLAGTLGTNKLFYNEQKTIEGLLAFFFSSCIAIIFIGWMAIPLALVCALAESINFHLDDNIIIPLACIIFFNII